MPNRYIMIMLIAICTALSAHPHIYIDNSIELDADSCGLKGIWEEWIIQRDFGENIIAKYDINRDEIFDPAETARVEKEAFQNLAKHGYFTCITIDDQHYHPLTATHFSVQKIENKTKYRFYAPCRIEAVGQKKAFKITIFDEARYVSFGLQNIDDPPNEMIDYTLSITHDDNIYSHSCLSGTVVLNIDLSLSRAGLEKNRVIRVKDDNLRRLEPLNSREPDSSANPFLATGIKINDGNTGNPFRKKK